MSRISTEKYESLNFYKYLCQKIGSEEVVRIRRFVLCIPDMSQIYNRNTISSGSKGEGLNLKGSDKDTMHIDPFFKVYESEKEVLYDLCRVPLIMNTEDTQPCFTQLRLLNHHAYQFFAYQFFKNLWQTSYLGCMLSSEQYKLLYWSQFLAKGNSMTKLSKIHGPCISDTGDNYDLAGSIKCDKWVSQAQPWVKRPRTPWPSPAIISKIISCGVLFVPIGCKGSINENLEWRISFSVAEKFLIFSFSHTQLLCYALLKILLKEIVEKHADLKGLLCSYFLKTLMFWISEETDPNLWRPDNIIPCFMACLQRLLYCVRYSILSHYFIPDNNLFNSRFNARNSEKLSTVLKHLYEQGIICFAASETLTDYMYQRQSHNIIETLTSENVIIAQQPYLCVPFIMNCFANTYNILNHYLHNSRTGVSKSLFDLYLSKACWFAPDASKYLYSSENKQQYLKYKYDLSQLLIGCQSDAVSGWLTLASFFYVKKDHFASLSVIHYALQKYTDEKILVGLNTPEYTIIQKHELNLMKKETLNTVLKTLIIEPLFFNNESSIIPQELQLEVTLICTLYHPIPFAYFLSFLCYYHLHDITSCRYYLQQLKYTITNTRFHTKLTVIGTFFMCGIAHQLMGETYIAKSILVFQKLVMEDKYNLSSAASRLSSIT